MSLNVRVCVICDLPIENRMNAQFYAETKCRCVVIRPTYFKHEPQTHEIAEEKWAQMRAVGHADEIGGPLPVEWRRS